MASSDSKKNTIHVVPTYDTPEDRQAALKGVMSKIEKDFGKGSIMILGENKKMNIETIPTGSLGLDVALGIGGYPRGRIVEIYGPEASGKTTLALHAIAETQKMGGIAAFIDAEHALDPIYAQSLGIDIDKLIISQPDNGEQATSIADTLVHSGVVDIVVIDSVAALVPKAEIDGEIVEQQMGLHARLMSKALRRLTSSINKSKAVTIFINQLREKIGGGGYNGPQEVTTGGRALKFYASVRLDVRRTEYIKKGEVVVANKTKVRVVKNKLSAPFKQAEFIIDYGKGISRMGEVADLAVAANIIRKAGSWYSYEDIKFGQGRENVIEALKKDEKLRLEIEEKVFSYYKEAGLKAASKKSKNSEDESSDDEYIEESVEFVEDDGYIED